MRHNRSTRRRRDSKAASGPWAHGGRVGEHPVEQHVGGRARHWLAGQARGHGGARQQTVGPFEADCQCLERDVQRARTRSRGVAATLALTSATPTRAGLTPLFVAPILAPDRSLAVVARVAD